MTSEVGRGTTFDLSLPEVEKVPARSFDEVAEANAVTNGTGLRLPVVEDNIHVGNFATQTLGDLRYQTSRATSAECALPKLDEDHFDVVFSDVVMPGMGGVALAKRLRITPPLYPRS
ncbi:response regulator [Lichenihabitans psoromatis]|uniref:response regulator n=1 Tax=Lichenihabitans psoromatis TaxID=2528642 RepID=UPI001035A159|nr:response regulator [Lichenihabitans psoromatis]